MEAFNSTTSFGPRTRFCEFTIFFQKYALQYRCWRLLACQKNLTLEISLQIAVHRVFGSMLVAPERTLLALS